MKILAIETETPGADWEAAREILKQEAYRAYELYKSGALRELYFDENDCAVLVLECENRQQAIALLQTLPLVNEGYISFEVRELKPYTGYERIMTENPSPIS
jgi:hypothetical protein